MVERNGYDEADFTNRLDERFLQKMDGSPYSGPGGYTNQSIRELYRARVGEGKAWGETGDYADTTEGAERAIVLAARYALSPGEGARVIARNIRLTQIDPYVTALSAAFGVIVSALIRGEPFDHELASKLYGMVEKAELPFTHVELAEKKGTYDHEPTAASASLPYPDGLLFPSHIWSAAKDPEVRIEPAWKVSLVYGMPCSIVLRAAGRLLSGGKISRRFRAGRFARPKRRGAKYVPGDACRRAGGGAGGTLAYPGALSRWTGRRSGNSCSCGTARLLSVFWGRLGTGKT